MNGFVFAVAENGCAYAHERGSFFYGYGVVAAHAHRYCVESAQVGRGFEYAAVCARYLGKVGADAGFVVGVRGHAHDSANVCGLQ